jgi:cell division protein FtsI/penicillin-binding protein 2
VKAIDDLKKARKALELRRFEKAQVQRQKIIDTAVALLAQKQSTESAILTKQENELREKADKEEADKIAKREKEWNDTIASRTAQVQAKLEQKRLDNELEERLNKAWREKSEEAHQREMAKQQRAKESLHQIKAIQFAEGVQRQRQKVEDRIVKIEQEKLLREVAAQVSR